MIVHIKNCTYFFSSLLTITHYHLIVLALLATFVVFFSRSFGITRKSFLGLFFISLGGVLNMLERQITGCVGDYFNFFGLFYFNIFDALVTLGTIILMYCLVVDKKEKVKKGTDE